MNNANDEGNRKVLTSLRDMPRAIQPPRDLWADIASQIGESQSGAQQQAVSPRSSRKLASLRWLAAAAVIAALAVGMWIGRTLMPVGGPAPEVAKNQPSVRGTPVTAQNEAAAFQAAYFSDPKYRQTRQALLDSLQAKLNSLPPDSRQKVKDSLSTIHKSMQDLEDALGKDPSNALLQELLLNTYQDEMRVLTTVHEAGSSGEGI